MGADDERRSKRLAALGSLPPARGCLNRRDIPGSVIGNGSNFVIRCVVPFQIVFRRINRFVDGCGFPAA
jgi:hypothetical protein